MCGLVLLSMPTIEFGGYFLLRVLSGGHQELALTPFQQSMFRAGHAHAGVLVILALVAILLAPHSGLSQRLKGLVQWAFPVAAILISGGFFAAASGKGITAPTGGIVILYAGIVVLATGMVLLGVGLLRNKESV